MKVAFTTTAWEDYLWFQDHGRMVLKRINLLIKDMLRTPFDGIGKPERLKADLAGYWSRRVTDEHRTKFREVVYDCTNTTTTIYGARLHTDARKWYLD